MLSATRWTSGLKSPTVENAWRRTIRLAPIAERASMRPNSIREGPKSSSASGDQNAGPSHAGGAAGHTGSTRPPNHATSLRSAATRQIVSIQSAATQTSSSVNATSSPRLILTPWFRANDSPWIGSRAHRHRRELSGLRDHGWRVIARVVVDDDHFVGVRRCGLLAKACQRLPQRGGAVEGADHDGDDRRHRRIRLAALP